MKVMKLSWISVVLTTGLLAPSTPAQESRHIVVEAILPDGSAAAMPVIGEDEVMEMARSIGAPTNPLGIPIIPREATVRLEGTGLTSQTVETEFAFLAFNLDEPETPDAEYLVTPQVALDPTAPGAQRVRFAEPLGGQVLLVIHMPEGNDRAHVAFLEGSPPLRPESLAWLENQQRMRESQEQVGVHAESESDIPHRVARARSEMRAVAVALESYFVDHHAFPAWIGGGSPHSLSQGNSWLTAMPTFRRFEPGGPASLTTPVAYLTSQFRDSFNLEGGMNVFSYFSDDVGWILVSPGPDGDFDITPAQDYSGKAPQPSAALVERTYDPTNGTVSDGDIYRTR